MLHQRDVNCAGRGSEYKYEVNITSCLIILNITPTASVCFDVEACFFITPLFCVKANGKGSRIGRDCQCVFLGLHRLNGFSGKCR